MRRHYVLHGAAALACVVVGLALLLLALAATARTLLLIRRFAPSLASHRTRAEFG